MKSTVDGAFGDAWVIVKSAAVGASTLIVIVSDEAPRLFSAVSLTT